MIQKAIQAMSAGDYKTLAACFTENCDYADFCPCMNGKRNYYLHGSAYMEMFFHQRFVSHRFQIFEPQVEDKNAASFFCTYDDSPFIFARFDVEEYDSNGRIAKAVVHPI